MRSPQSVATKPPVRDGFVHLILQEDAACRRRPVASRMSEDRGPLHDAGLLSHRRTHANSYPGGYRMTESSAPERNDKRGVILGVSIAVIAVLILGGGAAYALAIQPAPEAPPSPSTEQPAVPDKPARVEPTAEPVALPTDCREIYTEEFLDAHENVDLNHEGVIGTPVSRFAPVEAIRETLPGIECQWGGPTEGGIYSAVNAVTPDMGIQLVAAATESGFTCDGVGGGITLCRYSETFPEDETDPANTTIWTTAEDVYLRDGLVVTTWFAGTASSIDAVTQPIYDTLWP